jgi:hypothetical protein
MKTCAYCGRENDDGAVHCRDCGTDEFEAASRVEALPRVPSPDPKPVPIAVVRTETDSNPFRQFIPRSESKLIFILAVACYSQVLSSLIVALASAFELPPPPVGYFTDGMPVVRVISAVLLAPILESLLLVGAIELVKVFRAPVWVQVSVASLLIAFLHCFPWRARGLVVAPMFAIHAASYVYWRPTSRKGAFGIVACMHSLHNLIPAIYLVAHAIQTDS